MNRNVVFAVLFLLSILVRFGLFNTKWNNLRHGSALDYGSAAIGVYKGQGLTINLTEAEKISIISNNKSGNYLKFYDSNNRQEFVEFLPGPAILLGYLWKIIPIYNFAPLIWVQIILDSILILLFYLVFRRKNKYIFLGTSLFMIFNIFSINKTLMVGYDYWPQFAVLGTFIGVYYGLIKKKPYVFFITGLIAGIAIWFRSITTFLPFFIVLFIIIYMWFNGERRVYNLIKTAFFYIFPVILLIGSLSILRYQQTGNVRPTRSTFWHSFFAGVGRFPNPYGITSNDVSILKYGQGKLENKYELPQLREMWKSPNSIYEQTLKIEAHNFIIKYPHLFIRNTIYRIGIMISPPLLVGGTPLISDSQKKAIFPIGILLILLWLIGFSEIYKKDKLLFYLCLTIYLYFIVAFSWFYVPGRVILPFLFINVICYFFGISVLIDKFKNRGLHATTNTAT